LAPPVLAENPAYTVTILCGNREYVFSTIGQTAITEETTVGELKEELLELAKEEVSYQGDDLLLWYNGTPLIPETASLADYQIPSGATLKAVASQADIAVKANLRLASSKRDFYRVDIEWGSLEFTYTPKKTWDPTNHTVMTEHSSDSWSWEKGANAISVTNHSSAPVVIEFKYQNTDDVFIDATWNLIGNDSNSSMLSVTLPAANMETVPHAEVLLMPKNWFFSESSEKQTIGHVTVTMSQSAY